MEMNKAKLNYLVDLLLFVSFFLVSVTGLMLFPGRRSRTDMVALHDWSGILLIVLAIVHFALHWKWIVSMTRSFFKRKKADLL